MSAQAGASAQTGADGFTVIRRKRTRKNTSVDHLARSPSPQATPSTLPDAPKKSPNPTDAQQRAAVQYARFIARVYPALQVDCSRILAHIEPGPQPQAPSLPILPPVTAFGLPQQPQPHQTSAFMQKQPQQQPQQLGGFEQLRANVSLFRPRQQPQSPEPPSFDPPKTQQQTSTFGTSPRPPPQPTPPPAPIQAPQSPAPSSPQQTYQKNQQNQQNQQNQKEKNQKNQEKQEKQKDKRLVLVLKNQPDTLPPSKSLEFRNAINKQLGALVVATVTYSSSKNIVLTTLEPYTATFLVEKEAWKGLFDIERYEVPETWSKIVAHGVPISSLEDIKRDIIAFNSYISLRGNPRWLRPPPSEKAASSLSFLVPRTQARQVLRTGLVVCGIRAKTEAFKPRPKA